MYQFVTTITPFVIALICLFWAFYYRVVEYSETHYMIWFLGFLVNMGIMQGDILKDKLDIIQKDLEKIKNHIKNEGNNTAD